ncbi:dephospho-CoA kinase [Plantactinospora sp. KLBMP9567]|uniref:dephospho-CoA kinase n=1 Tax=Plantactinospora sp. KLBMP9567 TaxID=3085900 RepID=UPI002980A7C1|nr:dephospho-CoA kinase [Plantactinospora sp. KLBMP9567]MDW5323229.1 dephospho-CoA kinase [Plantactinospora sp. KLBMP9567]
MLKVGLTGGIGSGKSVVAARLADLGAVVVDSDRIAREVVAPGTDGLREVVAAFGARVCAEDGSLDRAALGEIVFADPSSRARLEAIIHPRVRRRSAELIHGAAPDAIVVNDVPLLVEVGLAPTYHLVLVVRAAESTRVERLVRDRGMTAEQAAQRIRAQAGDERRAVAADVLLDNDGELAELHASVDVLWRDRLTPYERNVRERRPVRATEARLVEPDPSWPAQYRRLAARIRHAVAPAEVRVDHIGSTSVPGLAAKDVVDIQLGVASLAEADALADRLADAGFPRCPGQWWDNPRQPGGTSRWEKRLHGGADPGRLVNLHVREIGSPGWRFALLMRDHLRADPERRADYLAVKRRLAAAGPDLDVYAEAKEPWFDLEHGYAEEWAAAAGWRPAPPEGS